MANQRRMAENVARYEAGHAGAPRKGSALLQGVAICGRCGRRISLRYTGPKAELSRLLLSRRSGPAKQRAVPGSPRLAGRRAGRANAS